MPTAPITGLDNYWELYHNHTLPTDRLHGAMYWYRFRLACEVRAPDLIPVNTYWAHTNHERRVRAIAGLAAALSPNQLEKTMWVGVDRILKGRKTAVGYGRDQRRAYAIFEGAEPLNILRGRKTRSFYRNIIDPSNYDEVVTVDGHMVNAWHGKVQRLNKVKLPATLYTDIETAIQEMAVTVSMCPSHLQALLWHAWKRKHGLAYNPQLNLLL